MHKRDLTRPHLGLYFNRCWCLSNSFWRVNSDCLSAESEAQCEVGMDPSECSFTDISGTSVRDLSPGVTLNQIFHPARHPGGFGCMNSGSFGQDFSHRVEKTSQAFWPPAAFVQHQGVYHRGLHPAGTGPEGPRWRCETYQCTAAGATARNLAV